MPYYEDITGLADAGSKAMVVYGSTLVPEPEWWLSRSLKITQSYRSNIEVQFLVRGMGAVNHHQAYTVELSAHSLKG